MCDRRCVYLERLAYWLESEYLALWRRARLVPGLGDIDLPGPDEQLILGNGELGRHEHQRAEAGQESALHVGSLFPTDDELAILAGHYRLSSALVLDMFGG